METVSSPVTNKQKVPHKPVQEDKLAEPDAYLSLLLTAERRNEKLEQENSDLIAERDMLKKQCDAQTEIISALKKDRKVVSMAKKSRKPSVQLNDIPEIDAEEFQPVNDVALLTDREKTLQAVKEKVGKTTATSVSATGSWLWKKTVSILT